MSLSKKILDVISEDVSLTWKPGSSKVDTWRTLVAKKYVRVGKFIRENKAKVGDKLYYIQVFEYAAFALLDNGNNAGKITHFGYGDFLSLSSRAKWTEEGSDLVSKFGRLFRSKYKSVKDMVEETPAPKHSDSVVPEIIENKPVEDVFSKEQFSVWDTNKNWDRFMNRMGSKAKISALNYVPEGEDPEVTMRNAKTRLLEALYYAGCKVLINRVPSDRIIYQFWALVPNDNPVIGVLILTEDNYELRAISKFDPTPKEVENYWKRGADRHLFD